MQLLSAGAERFVGRLPEGVLLCNARGAHTPSTAEWAVTATLAAQRGIPFFVREQEAGRWSSATFSSLVGARVLVVGAGDIGTTIGRMLAGFDVELTYVARTARDGVRSTAELPELLPHADVVIVIVPVTPETTGMVDARFLAAMADGALLVNAARGVVVDTDALVAELTSGRLGPRSTSPIPSRSGGAPAVVGAGPAAHSARRGCGARHQRPRRRGGHRPAGPGARRGAAGQRRRPLLIQRRRRDVDPPPGDRREAGQVAGAHHRERAPPYRGW